MGEWVLYGKLVDGSWCVIHGGVETRFPANGGPPTSSPFADIWHGEDHGALEHAVVAWAEGAWPHAAPFVTALTTCRQEAAKIKPENI